MRNIVETKLEVVRNIVVEGIECGGKTTLINEVRRKIPGWDLKYLGHKEGDQFRRYAWEYNVNSGTIFNRAHFSEVVYSALSGRGEPFTETERLVLDDLIAKDSIVIFCDPAIEDVKNRYMQRDTVQPVNFEELDVVHGLFKSVFESIPHLKYSSTGMESRDSFVNDLSTVLRT